MSSLYPIVLGSSSKSRQSILRASGIKYTVLSPNIHEKSVAPHLRSDPSAYVLSVAHAKMDALIPTIANPSIVITCDQVVSWKGQVREKPESASVG